MRIALVCIEEHWRQDENPDENVTVTPCDPAGLE